MAISIDRLFVILLCLALLAACTGTGPNHSTAPTGESDTLPDEPPSAVIPKKVVLLRHTGTRDSIEHLAAQTFKESLEAQSNGMLLVDIYPETAMGTSSDMAYAMRYGNVTMHIGDPLFDTEKCFSWTAVSGDLSTYRQALFDGPVREIVDDACLQAGVLFLGSVSDEYYYLTSERPAGSLAELGGLRVAETKLPLQGVWELAGAATYLCAEEEVFPLAQRGAINAMHNRLQSSLPSQLAVILPYLICVNQRVYSRMVYISKRFYDSLGPEEQAMVERAVEDTRQSVREYTAQHNADILAAHREQGGSVIDSVGELEAVLRQELTASGLLETTYGETLPAQLRAALAAA